MQSCGFASNNSVNIVNQVKTILCPCLGSVGLIGHLMNVWILTSSDIWSRLWLYLSLLTMWDIVVLVAYNSIVLIYALIPPTMTSLFNDAQQAMLVLYYLMSLALVGRVWATCLITAERYVAICRPVYHLRFQQNSRLYGIVTVLLNLFLVCVMIPRYYELQIIQCYDNVTQTVADTIVVSSLRENDTFFWLYVAVFKSVVVLAIPLPILMVYTIKMLLAIRTSFNTRRNALGRQSTYNRSFAKLSVQAMNSDPSTVRKVTLQSNPESNGLTRSCRKQSSYLSLNCNENIESKRLNQDEDVSLHTPAYRSQSVVRFKESQDLIPTATRCQLSTQHIAANTILLTVPVSLVICYTITVVLDVMEALQRNVARSTTFTSIAALGDTLVVLNSSIPFYLNCIFSGRFRQQLKRKLLLLCRRQQPARQGTFRNNIEDRMEYESRGMHMSPSPRRH